MGDKCETIETGDGGQRHGRRAHPRRAAEGRARAVRHHGVRRRAAPQLQPHPAVAGAGRRADAGRDRAELLGLVRRRTASRCTPARRWSRSTACAAWCAPTTAPRRHTTGCCCAPAPTRSSCRCRARSCEGVIAYRDIADTNAMIEAAQQVQAGGGHRRRPAGPGGGQRPDAARHGRHGGARHALADGAPARRRGRQAAAEVAGRARPEVPARRADAGTGRRRRRPGRRRCSSRTAATCRRRPGRDGRGHPPQHRAGREDAACTSTAASSSTTRCRP